MLAESYFVDLDGISTSGLSAGGAMAPQFHVAHSASVMGSATFAGGECITLTIEISLFNVMLELKMHINFAMCGRKQPDSALTSLSIRHFMSFSSLRAHVHCHRLAIAYNH